MRTVALAVILLSITSVPAVADTLDQELRTARQHIASRNFNEAVDVLEAALPRTASLQADIQPQARTAIHFYAAVAYSALGREDDAEVHLGQALRITPQMRSIDSTKFDARFVELFERLRGEKNVSERFDKLYPGFASAVGLEPVDSSTWGESPALEILGSKAEKREWRAIVSPAERERFIAEFWRLRDQVPQTDKNEFRETFERRTAFADAMFGSPGHPGALTDRGRVFVLFGTPAIVRRRALTSRDVMTVMSIGSRDIENGTIEYWFYTREQIPSALAKPSMMFRFVSHQGIGHYVLQKEGLVMNALAIASRRPGE